MTRPHSGDDIILRLDRAFSRMGAAGGTIALTALAVLAAMAVHLVLKHFEGGRPIPPLAWLNIVAEAVLVSVPLILHSRRVIAQLYAARKTTEEMARRVVVAAEEAQHANRAKSAFLANMSHELRTPLNAILGFSEVMKDQHMGPLDNPRYLAYARDIHVSGGFLLGIINDILDLSKIEAGKMSLDGAEEFPLADAIRGAAGMVEGLAQKFGVAIAVEPPPPGVRVVAVERMVRQILINLIGNAIKFTPAGGTVAVNAAAAGDGYAVTVRDTGIGMSAEDIAHALTPFGQVENQMNTTHAGTGLGLPLAKAMMELHGGTMRIDSVPKKGTSVVLTFPAARLARAAAAA
jgi:signal transduction histidine kinase